ncbi:MAG: YfhO family protein [Bacteroidia bacterium]|nr:YfhO family protein [Bacteroidia bacterium]
MSKQVNSKQNPSLNQEQSIYDKYINGKELYFLMGLVLLSCYIIFSDFIHLKKIYLFKDIGSDTINMYHPLLIHLSEYIKQEGVPGWSFSQGMGQNVFPLWLGDFFSNFIMLFDKGTIPKVIVYMELLKIILCALIFFKYLQELKVTGFASLIGALLYAFTGYVILGGTWIIFSTEAVYVAVLLLGVESWLNRGKWFLLLLGITLIGFLQPFYLYSYTIFLIGYIIIRYNDIHEGDWKGFIMFSFKTIGIAIVGVGITAYQLLPDVLMLLESPRVGGEASLSARLKAQPMFDLADDILRFTTTYRAFGSDMLGVGSNFKGWQNYLEAPLFYCGILGLVTFPHVFSSLTRKQKLFYGFLTFAFVLPILFPFFRYAFWAFSGDYFRTFSLIIIIFILFYTVKAISFIEKKHEVNKIVLIVTGLFLLFLLYTPATQFKSAIDTGLRSFVTGLIFAYSGFIYMLSSKTSLKQLAKVAIIATCFIEVNYFSSISINKRVAMFNSELTSKVGYNDYTIDAVNYLKGIDKSFYRINKDYLSGLAIHGSINDAKAQGFYGTPSYHSFNQKNYIKFLGDLNVIDPKDENATRWAKGLGDRPILFSLASGKYWLSKRVDGSVKSMGFDSIAKFGDVTVYKNRFALPFGFTYDKGISEDEFKKMSPTQKDFCLLRACVVDNENKVDFEKIKSFNIADTAAPMTFDNYLSYVNNLKVDEFKISSFTENNIKGSISVNETKVLFFSIPFDEGWHATLNGTDTKLYRVNAGLTGLLIQKGLNEVTLSFEPRLKEKGKIISILSVIVLI